MSEQLNAIIDDEQIYDPLDFVLPAQENNSSFSLPPLLEALKKDLGTTKHPDSPTPEYGAVQDEQSLIDISAEVNCDECNLKIICNGEDEQHFLFTRLYAASEAAAIQFGDYMDTDEGKAHESELKSQWAELVIEQKTEELIATEVDATELENLLSEFENEEYSPMDTVEGELVWRDGKWDLSIQGADGKEYSLSTSKSSAEKDEHGNTGTKELLSEMMDGLLENGYYKYESEELITIYTREGTKVLIYSYEKAQPDDVEDDNLKIAPNGKPESTPQNHSPDEGKLSVFERKNTEVLKSTGIGIKTEVHATNPQEFEAKLESHSDKKKLGDKSGRQENHATIKISDQEHSAILKFLGIQRSKSTPTDLERSANLSPMSKHIEEVVPQQSQQAEQAESAQNAEAEEITEEPDSEEELREESQIFPGAIESSTSNSSKVSRESKTGHLTEVSSSLSSQSDKVVAKETIRPTTAQEQSRTAITQPEINGPDTPTGPNLEPQIQRNEDGTESVVTVVKFAEQEIPITSNHQEEVTRDTQAVVEERSTAAVETIKEIIDRNEQLTEAISEEPVTRVESTDIKLERSIEQDEQFPTIEEIIAERRAVDTETNTPEAAQRSQSTKSQNTEAIRSAPLTSSELNEAKSRIQKQTERAQDALTALRQIRNAPRSTETLRQYQPGDQPAPIVNTDSTAQEREEELLQLAA